MFETDMTNKNGLPIVTAYIPEGSSTLTTRYATITESGCNSANTYTCTAITYPNGTSVNLNIASTLSLQATVTDGVAKLNVTFIDLSSLSKTQIAKSYVGSRTLKMTCSIEVTTTLPNMIAQPYIRYNIEPVTFSDFMDDDFDYADLCSSPAFPLFFGDSDGHVVINYLGETNQDSDILFVGKANSRPFAPNAVNSSSPSQGFIALYNSFGAPIWIYYLRSDTNLKTSECYHASEATSNQMQLGLDSSSNNVILGVCKVWNQEYNTYQGVLVALDRFSGGVKYAKFLPRDLYADYHGYTDFEDFNSPLFVVEVNPTASSNAYAGDILVISEYQYDNSDHTSTYYTFALTIFDISSNFRKFHNYISADTDDDSYPAADFLLNTAADDGSFYLFTHSTD